MGDTHSVSLGSAVNIRLMLFRDVVEVTLLAGEPFVREGANAYSTAVLFGLGERIADVLLGQEH